jgi:hypothetical protein
MLSRTLRFQLLRILLLVAVGSFGGCGSLSKPGIYQVGNWGPSRFLEDGQEVSLYTLQCQNVRVTSYGYSPTTEYSAILDEEPTRWERNSFYHGNARRLWDTAPPWRREENLIALGKRLTADQPKFSKRVLISSHGPVVVGVSDERDTLTREADPFWNFSFFLGTKPLQNRAEIVTRLYLTRSWPNPDETLGVPADREEIVLARPTSTDEVMRTRPWER